VKAPPGAFLFLGCHFLFLAKAGPVLVVPIGVDIIDPPAGFRHSYPWGVLGVDFDRRAK
jgi:hypothetical protein